MLKEKYPHSWKLLTNYLELVRINEPISQINLYNFFDCFGYKVVPELFMLQLTCSFFLPKLIEVTNNFIQTYKLYKENNVNKWLKLIDENNFDIMNIKNNPLTYDIAIKETFLFAFELMEKRLNDNKEIVQ